MLYHTLDSKRFSISMKLVSLKPHIFDFMYLKTLFCEGLISIL